MDEMVHPSSPCKSGQHTLLLENFPPIEAGCTTVQIWLFLTPFLVPLETLLMNDGQGYQLKIVGAEVWDPDSNSATWRCSHRVGSLEDCHLFISSPFWYLGRWGQP